MVDENTPPSSPTIPRIAGLSKISSTPSSGRCSRSARESSQLRAVGTIQHDSPRRCSSPPRSGSSRRCSSPRSAKPDSIGQTHFDMSEELFDELMARSAPLSQNGSKWQRKPRSRIVLLSCYAATHGNGCLLQQRNKGILTSERRSVVVVDLWRKLTGDEATPAEKILMEAAAAYRKNTNVRTPSPSFRRWLAGSPSGTAGATTGFGSKSEQRLHPGIKAGLTDSSIDAPAPGSYNPEEIQSQASKGSTWSRITTASRLSKASSQDPQDRRQMPWDTRDVTPAMGDYHTSCRNMANQAAKHEGRVSPGMSRPSPASRLQGVKANVKTHAGPGSYDLGGFNLSRNDRARPSSAFASKAARPSPFGRGPLVANVREM